MTDMTRYQSPELSTMQLGEVLKASGYFQDVREASQAIVKVLAGREMGIGPIAAMTGIYIVKGRVTLSANLMAAQIKRSGRYNYHVRRMDETGCEIEFFEGERSIGVSSFDDADAKAAGLLGGENWRKFPRNMYFARAISNGAKWYCPDVFSGPVYTPDELSATQGGSSYVDASTGEIIDHDQPTQEPLATTKQYNYIAVLRDKLNWNSEQLAAYAEQQGIDDLAFLTVSQAKPFIDGLKAMAEERTPAKPNGKAPPSRASLLTRIAELTAQADELSLEIILSKPLDQMTDDELVKHGTNLRTAIGQAENAKVRKAAGEQVA